MEISPGTNIGKRSGLPYLVDIKQLVPIRDASHKALSLLTESKIAQGLPMY